VAGPVSGRIAWGGLPLTFEKLGTRLPGREERMCGIAGIYGHRISGIPDSAMDESLGLLKHRGPDGSGIYRDEEIILGHRRLAIIDLTTGGQPLANEDGSVQVACNGEVFNYLELRAELMGRGHRFSTSTDIEVLAHLYEECGTDLFERINGQFALALWDAKQKRLVLARDRFGICPLFYARHGESLVFASTVRALTPFVGRPAIDPRGLCQVFTFWNTLAPRTAFSGIHQLRPGECMIIDRSGTRSFLYWDIGFPRMGEHDVTDPDQAAEGIREILDDATAVRLRADVPVGAYLSGGLDSSILTSLVKRHTPVMETFSVSFSDPAYDESAFQTAMGERLGTRHHVTKVSPDDIARIFPEVIRHTESPVLRTAPAPMYLLSRLARDHGIKVVLTGEGSDEIFGGYDIFKEAKIRRFWSRFPDSKIRPLLLFRLYPYSPVQMKRSGRLLISFYRSDLLETGHFGYSHLPTWRNTSAIQEFFNPDFRETLIGYDPLEELRGSLNPDFFSWHPLNQAQYLEMKLLLAGYLLSSQGERMAMANSVEGRYPFLDHRVAEYAARIAPRLKLSGLKEKFVLKQAFAGQLPREIFTRTKQPYGAPNKESFFLDGRPRDTVSELLSPESLSRTGIFDPASVARLSNKCAASGRLGFRDSSALVGILSTEILLRDLCR
jgi:asparagine synthase (glutamine-hydrolysing)